MFLGFRFRLVVQLLSAFSIVLASSAAQAQRTRAPTEDGRIATAREEFERGVSLVDAQRWREAVDAFRVSLANVERQSTRLNLGIALVRASEPVEARGILQQYVEVEEREREPDAEGIASARREITAATEMIAHLALSVAPGDATVTNGEETLRSGQLGNIELNPGRTLLGISAPRFRAQQLEINLRAGERAERHVILEEAPPEIMMNPPPAAQDRGGGSVFEEPWFWIVAGVVIVGAGVGIGVAATSSGPVDRGTTGVTIRALEERVR